MTCDPLSEMRYTDGPASYPRHRRVGIARVHARLAAEAMAKGRARSANDKMIAATAASTSTSRILLTTDASADFDQLTGVRAEALKLP
jgi:tRNA(fMet)-specific endonuclease VapC